jgi:hypothetical protein
MFLVPTWAPLIVGLLIAFNIGSPGGLFRRLAQEAEEANADKSTKLPPAA